MPLPPASPPTFPVPVTLPVPAVPPVPPVPDTHPLLMHVEPATQQTPPAGPQTSAPPGQGPDEPPTLPAPAVFPVPAALPVPAVLPAPVALPLPPAPVVLPRPRPPEPPGARSANAYRARSRTGIYGPARRTASGSGGAIGVHRRIDRRVHASVEAEGKIGPRNTDQHHGEPRRSPQTRRRHDPMLRHFIIRCVSGLPPRELSR